MKERILNIVYGASLSAEAVALWEQMLDGFSDDLAGDILNFLETVPGGLKIMTDNLFKKVDALKKGELGAWEDALGEDIKFIQSYT